MGTVNKSDIVREVATETNQSISATQTAIDAFLGKVATRAEHGDTVRLSGFGSFSVKARQARAGRNPRTGETLMIPETRKLTFKASKTA